MLQLFSPCSDHLVTVLLLLLFFFAGCGGGPALSCFSVLTLALRSFLVHFFFNETFEC